MRSRSLLAALVLGLAAATLLWLWSWDMDVAFLSRLGLAVKGASAEIAAAADGLAPGAAWSKPIIEAATVNDSEALDELARVGAELRRNQAAKVARGGEIKSPPLYEARVCRHGIAQFGSGNAFHNLCVRATPLPRPCHVFSYGIETDWSFDKAIVDRLNCNVHAFDPTVTYPETMYANLSSAVRFKRWGAPMFNESTNVANWTLVSPMEYAKTRSIERVHVLKMDCEGCEYALYRDAMRHDAEFFTKVDQFALEIHLSRFWIASDETALQLGKLLVLLKRAGLELVHYVLWRCNSYHERFGCPLLLQQQEYPCYKGIMWCVLARGAALRIVCVLRLTRFFLRTSQNLLFARAES